MVADKQLVTWREFAQYPTQMQPIQLLGGVVTVSPSPSPEHQSVVAELLTTMMLVSRERHIEGRWFPAPLDVWLSPYDVVQPDLSFFRQDQLPMRGQLPVMAIPAIVAEVMSPGSRTTDLKEKLPKYAARGIAEYWVLDPASKRFTLYLLNDDGTYAATPFPGGSLPAGLFAGTPLELDTLFSL